MAISWMTRIWITSRVRKPMTSVASAVLPGASRRRKAMREAVSESAPLKTSERAALTICTAWLTAIAKTRNGTRIDIGSMP